MGRRKAAPQKAPSTLPEAIGIIERYLVISSEIESTKGEADRAIIAVQTTRDEVVAPLKAEAEDLFLQLRAWWGVAGPEMTRGKTKSIELAGAMIGERTTTPSLRAPRGVKADEAVALIEDIVDQFPAAADLLRKKTELDKQAIIKLLRSSTAVGPVVDEVKAKGFTVSQRDEFFVDRAAPKEIDPELVEAVAPAMVEVQS